MAPIYLDGYATTQPLDGVVEAIMPFPGTEYADASGVHQSGQRVRHKVEGPANR